MPVLVDTDWIIHSLRGRADIIEKMRSYAAEGIAVSVVSLAELYEGVFYSNDPLGSEAGLSDFLNGATILDIDTEIARIFARERGRLRKLRQMIGDMDLLIAASAIRHGLALLSNNRRHFERIENLRIISM
jgi:tRNA(fMet)-specific endonuclease VapC